MRNFFIILLISLILIITEAVVAQKENYNWYFGEKAGITFNTDDGEPIALLDGALINFEGCSTISDSNGNLLFYTNGITVWNRLHQVMNNGTGLYGHESSSQSALIVPRPGSTNIYYIFTTNAFESNYNNGFNYSIVDMNLDNSMGSVSQKNINLQYNYSEKVASISSENGKEIWIVTQHAVEQCFITYLLTESGLSTIPVKSPNKIDLNHKQNGMLKFSPNGDKLAMTHYIGGSVYLYDFNFSTGKITNEFIFKSNLVQSSISYGLEFSGTGQFLYYTSSNSTYTLNYLHQIDISSNNTDKINNSEKIINQNTSIPFLGTLQIGPNKKIYLAITGNYISVIGNPDLSGIDCNFQYNGLSLNGRKSQLGLPSIVQRSNLIAKKTDSIFVCERDPIFLKSTYYENAVYKWSDHLGFSSDKQNPVILNSNPDMSGEYVCKIYKNGKLIEINSTFVTVNPRSKINFSDLKFISVCNDTLNLVALDKPDSCKILWKEINSTKNKVTIRTSGSYTVYVENQYGCIDSATIQINLNKMPEVEIISNNGNVFCTGEKIILSANKPFAEYYWSNGKKTPEITITRGGKYYLKVKNEFGCEAVDSIEIQEYEKPGINFAKQEYTICKGDSLILAPLEIKSEYQYIWSDGITNPIRTVKQTSELFLIAKSSGGCSDTAFVGVIVLDFPFAEIFAQDTVICNNGNITLSAKNVSPDFEYLWSTGETSERIVVSESGFYKLTINNKNLCSDTDSVEITKSPEMNLVLLTDKNSICFGDSVRIYSQIKYNYYYWSTGERSESIFVKEKGNYSLNVINEFGCIDTAYIKVEFLEMPVSSILADVTEVCFGENIILKSENYNPDFSYLWSTGETTESITVSESGIYKLFVTNENLCSDTTEIEVKIHDDLALELLADRTNLCFDDSTRIYTTSTYSEYYWSTSETTPVITVKEAGIYKLIVKNEFGCADTAEIEIFKYESEIEFDKAKLIFDELCVGDSLIVRLQMTIKSSTDLTISSITTTSNSYEIINYNALLKSYKNGEIINIEIKFKPQDAGNFDDELVISSTEPCEFVKSIPISASAKQVLEFSFGEHYSEAGQMLEIPILGQIICPAPQSLTTDYEIEVAFDKEYFSPESVKFGQINSNSIVGNERVIKIKADGDFSQVKSEINVIYGRSLLGRSEQSQIKIAGAKFTRDRYFAGFTNGSLNVDGCVNDITTIQMFAPTRMTISPNPSDGELKVSIGTQEQGSFRLVVFDIQGREVYRTEFSKSDKTFEQKDFNINTLNLGNGIYTIHLTAPWTLLREQVVVVR